MFGIGWSELLLVIIVAVILIKPEDLPYILKTVKSCLSKINLMKEECKKIIQEIDQEGQIKDIKDNLYNTKKKITDLEGNLQEAFDLSEIMPDIIEKNNAQEQEKNPSNEEEKKGSS